MDFGSLLYKAQRNDQDNKQNAGWYRTTFAPPKKEQREKKLSANIQKFLAKKEEEEKRKRTEAEKKKQELLTLRNKDKKSFKRVKSMLTKTKSANKSVIEDAVDNVNTAVTANGPAQPDEDDYGYVSKDAEELYNKLINKYNNMPPEESKFSKASKCSKDVLSTKDRVKAALLREEEEKFLPKKRKRKSKNGEVEDDKSDDEKKDAEKEEKTPEVKSQNKFKIPKRNPQLPPPIDFQSLLKLAEKKQHEPIMIEKKIEEKPERPMTEKEKLEYMREKERKLRKEMGISENTQKSSEMLKAKAMKLKSEMAVKSQSDTSSPVLLDRLKNGANSSLKRSQPSTSSSQKPTKTVSTPKKVKFDEPKPETPKEEKPPAAVEKPAIGALSEKQKMILAQRRNAELETRKMAILEARRREAKLNNVNQSKEPCREKLSNTPSKIPKTEAPMPKISKPLDSHSSKSIPVKPLESKKPTSASIPSRQFPPPDVTSRKFPPPDVARRFPPSDAMRKKPKPVMRRKVIESDDEYDSEMDDFIDDSEEADVSHFISEIFGYDRKKYSARDYEDEDECMESNFSELQKEEFISTKYGIMEDLEDVRRTKAEKLRKKKRMMS